MSKKINKIKVKDICITYAPFDYPKEPVLSQNSNLPIFITPTYSYPIISSMAATLLKNSGYSVSFFDGVAENISTIKWLDFIKESKPDLIFLEPSTFNISYYFDIVNSIKVRYSGIIIVFGGEHVSALPNESFEKSKIDYVISGGDYDLILLNLVNYLNGKEKLGKGVYRLVSNNIKFSGAYKDDIFLDNMPYIDRDLTNWKLYSSENMAFKRARGAYISISRGCFHNKCTFCRSSNMYQRYRIRSPHNVFKEIDILNKRYHINEVIDSSLTLPTDEWLNLFCQMMIESKLNKKVLINCNMRIDNPDDGIYKLMKNAGFRTIYFGIESAKQNTLENIKKDIAVNDIIINCYNASKAGLLPYVTFTIGYPWESEDDIRDTISLAKILLQKGYACAIQPVFAIPYPGTDLFEYCKKEDLFITEEWFRYNMLEPIIKTSIDTAKMNKYISDFYNLMLHPKYILHRILSIRDLDDIKYYIKLLKTIYCVRNFIK